GELGMRSLSRTASVGSRKTSNQEVLYRRPSPDEHNNQLRQTHNLQTRKSSTTDAKSLSRTTEPTFPRNSTAANSRLGGIINGFHSRQQQLYDYQDEVPEQDNHGHLIAVQMEIPPTSRD